jgi:molecular chaperone DnaK
MIVGIDLGTTDSAIAYMNKDGRPEIITNREGKRLTPSAVMFDDDGTVVVGDIAKDSARYFYCITTCSDDNAG